MTEISKVWSRYTNTVPRLSPNSISIVFTLPFSSSGLAHVSRVWLFSCCSLQFCMSLNIPIVACFEPATDLSEPRDSHLNLTIAHFSLLHFFYCFLCVLCWKRVSNRGQKTWFFFLLMLLHSLFWIFSFSRTLRDYQSTTENNFFSNKIGPDPNSLALKKRLLVNSMDFEWRINPSVLRLRNSGQLW